MLDDLVGTIEKLKRRIERHKRYFEEGGQPEWRTRIGLIDPLLKALGWDVADPRAVEIEPKVTADTPTGKGWADYALMGSLGSNPKPVVIIEAKNLSIKKPPLPQTVGYVVNENMTRAPKIPYCAWTNGDEWGVYDVSTQNQVMQASIEGEDSAELALKFLSLWNSTLREGRIVEALSPLTDAVEPDGPPPPPPPPPSPGWTPLTGSFEVTGSSSPTE